MNVYRDLFRNWRSGNQQFVTIGLGRFGLAVCQTLHDLGYEVLGIDAEERNVTQALNDKILSHALQLDSTDRTALKEAGVFELDTAIVAIGSYVEASVITTLNLKEAGVPYVLAKASSDIHGRVLRKVGADRVVFPEQEMGQEVARALTKPGILDRFELDPNHSIVEVVVPEDFDGKTLAELQLRARYGLTAIAVSPREGNTADGKERFEINPMPNARLRAGMAMVVVGENQAIDRLPWMPRNRRGTTSEESKA